MPSTCGTPPARRTFSASATELVSTIRPSGSSSGRQSSSPVARMATRGRRGTRTEASPCAGEQRQLGDAEHRPGREQHLSGPGVLAGVAHVLARRHRLLDLDPAEILARQRSGALLHHHRVRSGRHGRAGHDPHRLARADRPRGLIAGVHHADHPQRHRGPRRIGAPQRVAVHRRVVPGRLRSAGRHVGREPEPERVLERQPDLRQRVRGRGGSGPGPRGRGAERDRASTLRSAKAPNSQFFEGFTVDSGNPPGYVPSFIHVAKPKPKTKSGAAKPGSRKNEARLGLLKKASAKVAKAAAKLVKSAAKTPESLPRSSRRSRQRPRRLRLRRSSPRQHPRRP